MTFQFPALSWVTVWNRGKFVQVCFSSVVSPLCIAVKKVWITDLIVVSSWAVAIMGSEQKSKEAIKNERILVQYKEVEKHNQHT